MRFLTKTLNLCSLFLCILHCVLPYFLHAHGNIRIKRCSSPSPLTNLQLFTVYILSTEFREQNMNHDKRLYIKINPYTEKPQIKCGKGCCNLPIHYVKVQQNTHRSYTQQSKCERTVPYAHKSIT